MAFPDVIKPAALLETQERNAIARYRRASATDTVGIAPGAHSPGSGSTNFLSGAPESWVLPAQSSQIPAGLLA
jgi:hypothetical protein